MATLADDVRDRAFERMYERYVRDVYRYVLAVLRNPADAEDVTQTTFMNAYRAFKRGERPQKPQNWLITIAHNACRTKAVRSSRRPKEIPLDDVVTQLAVPEQERPNVRELLKALGDLPFNQRAAIAMHELEGRSYKEIAETLDVSVPAVEALIVRARRALRMHRAAIRGLVSVQLPRSLRFLFESSDTTTGLTGGATFAKAAAVLVAGVVAGGVGYAPVEAGAAKPHDPAPARLEPRPHAQARDTTAAVAVISRPVVVPRRERPAVQRVVVRRLPGPVPPEVVAAVPVAPGEAASPTVGPHPAPVAAPSEPAAAPEQAAPAAALAAEPAQSEDPGVVEAALETVTDVAAALPLPALPPLPVPIPAAPQLPALPPLS